MVPAKNGMPGRSFGGKSGIGGIALAVALTLLSIFLFWRWFHHGFDWSLFRRLLASARWPWLIAGWAIGLWSYFIRALRWRVMAARLSPHLSTWRIFLGTLIGYTALVIFGRPGEFVRPIMIARSEGVSVPSQLALWLLERIYDGLMLFMLFGFAVTVAVHNGVHSNGPLLQFAWRAGGWVAASVCCLLMAVLIGLHFYSSRIESALDGFDVNFKQGFIPKAVAFIRRAIEGVHSVRGVGAVSAVFVLTGMEWVSIAFMYFAVLQAFPTSQALHFSDAVVFTGMAGIGAIVQIPGVGGGIQLASIAALTEFFHLRFEEAGLIALAAWFTSFVGVVPFGLMAAVHRGWTWGRLLRLSREEGEVL